MEKYNTLPNKTSIEIEIDNRRDLNEQDVKVIDIIKSLEKDDDVNLEWLVETTEKFCKDKERYIMQLSKVYKSLMEKIEIEMSMLSRAFSQMPFLGFDNSVGHDYLLDAESRFEFYHTVEEKIPFDLDFFNRITKGGLPPKTLNIALAGTGVGKSLFMCHMDLRTV